MKTARILGYIAALMLAVFTAAYATEGEIVKLRRDLSKYPAGDYRMIWSYESETSEQLNDNEPNASKMKQVFTFDMKYEPPGKPPEREPGRMDLKVRRVQVKVKAGETMSYDSDGKPEEQSEVLAGQFKHMIGLESIAEIKAIDSIGPFKGLDKGWDAFSEENPDLANVAQMNKKNYGDAMLDRIMKLGLEFVQAGQDRIKAGDVWEVTIEKPGLRWVPREMAHKCKLKSVKDGHAVIAVKWENNEMKPEVSPAGEMTTYGTDEKGSAGFKFHAKSLMLTQAMEKTERVDQVAGGEPGNISQVTRTTKEQRLFSIRPAETQTEELTPEKVAVAVLTAYKNKDLPELAQHSIKANAEMITEMIEEGDKHSRYKSLFGGFRWKSVKGWDGEIREVRYPSATMAWVAYSEGDDERDLFVVVLVLEKGRWLFEDLNMRNRESFEKAGKKP